MINKPRTLRSSSQSWKVTLVFTIIIVCLPHTIQCWYDHEDFEIFDLVEEIGENFYQLLNVSQTASTAEIKRSFRSLSLIYHPDKNSEADAELKFRHLVSAAEVLKDEIKRAKYDQVLINGLPNWKSGIYYYRRVRKLGLLEMSIIVSLIFTIGHYLCLVAGYWEKKYEIDQVLRRRNKKLLDKEYEKLKVETFDQLGIREPKLIRDNLVVKCSLLLLYLLQEGLPLFVKYLINCYREYMAAKEAKKDNQENAGEEGKKKKDKPKKKSSPQELNEPSKSKEPKKKKTEVKLDANKEPPKAEDNQQPQIKTGPWTQEEISNLVELSKKFPVGTRERWTKIAVALGRPEDEVIARARDMKALKPVVSNTSQEKVAEPTEAKPEANHENTGDGVKQGKDNKPATKGSDWTTEQKKALEEAIRKHPEHSSDRWELIAKEVPGKTKEECQRKYENFLAKKKAKTEAGGKPQGDHWTKEQKEALAQAVKKYPKGSKHRWEKISQEVGRNQEECITKYTLIMEYKARQKGGKQGEGKDDDANDVPANGEDDGKEGDGEAAGSGEVPAQPKGSTEAPKSNADAPPQATGANDDLAGSNWTQEQQKALEMGLKKYPKGTPERWEKISAAVNGKTKEECMIRFVLLAELRASKKLTKCEKPKADPKTDNKTEPKAEAKTVPRAESTTGKEWTAEQKTALIRAAKKYPKGTKDRWTKVAQEVGKTKEECMTRYTFIIEHKVRKENKKANRTETKPDKPGQQEATTEAQPQAVDGVASQTPTSSEDAKNEKED